MHAFLIPFTFQSMRQFFLLRLVFFFVQLLLYADISEFIPISWKTTVFLFILFLFIDFVIDNTLIAHINNFNTNSEQKQQQHIRIHFIVWLINGIAWKSCNSSTIWHRLEKNIIWPVMNKSKQISKPLLYKIMFNEDERVTHKNGQF